MEKFLGIKYFLIRRIRTIYQGIVYRKISRHFCSPTSYVPSQCLPVPPCPSYSISSQRSVRRYCTVRKYSIVVGYSRAIALAGRGVVGVVGHLTQVYGVRVASDPASWYVRTDTLVPRTYCTSYVPDVYACMHTLRSMRACYRHHHQHHHHHQALSLSSDMIIIICSHGAAVILLILTVGWTGHSRWVLYCTTARLILP